MYTLSRVITTWMVARLYTSSMLFASRACASLNINTFVTGVGTEIILRCLVGQF
jgi:hypothetical protein